MTDTYDDEPDASSIAELPMDDIAAFWRAIHRMSSATYVPTRSCGVLTVPNQQQYTAAARSAAQKRWGWRPL